MIHQIYTFILLNIGKKLYENNPKYDITVYTFGLDLLINKLIFLFSLIFYGIITQKNLESLIFYLIFEFLRKYCGGIHFDNRVICFIISLTLAIVNIELCHYLNVVNPLFILNISLFIILVGPVDTSNKRLDIEEKLEYKKMIVFIVIFINLFIFIFESLYMIFANLLAFILLSETILLLFGICNNKFIMLFKDQKA